MLDKAQQYFQDSPEGFGLNNLNADRLPKHIAVIMDGNGRWAEQRGLSRGEGHMAGVNGMREVIVASVRLGIEYLSVFAFSTENWTRPHSEVETLMHLFATVILDELPLLDRENVHLEFIGDMDGLPEETRNSFQKGYDHCKNHSGMNLIVAVNYGSRAEILRAVKKIALDVENENKAIDDITEDDISNGLYTAGIPDPDLLIRTSGEKRLSNFLLWQLAYTEFYVTETLWPDFNRYDLLKAIIAYQKRDRRFGGLTS